MKNDGLFYEQYIRSRDQNGGELATSLKRFQSEKIYKTNQHNPKKFEQRYQHELVDINKPDYIIVDVCKHILGSFHVSFRRSYA